MTVRATGSSSSCGQAWKPRSALPVAVTSAAMASGTLTRPAPSWYAEASSPFDVDISASLSRAPVQSGCCSASRAATPETCGVAIDVPSMAV